MNLANKYRPKTFEDVTEQGLVVDMLKGMCESEHLQNRNFLFTGSAGVGKAQPLDSLVLTPTGFKKMEYIKEGTVVTDVWGHPTKVLATYDQGLRDIYKIKFDDGSEIQVADNHLNSIFWYDSDKQTANDQLLETTELIELFKTTKFKLKVKWASTDNWGTPQTTIDGYIAGSAYACGRFTHGALYFKVSDTQRGVLNEKLKIHEAKLSHINSRFGYMLLPLHVKEKCSYKYLYEGHLYTNKELNDMLELDGLPKLVAKITRGLMSINSRYRQQYPQVRKIKAIPNGTHPGDRYNSLVDELISIMKQDSKTLNRYQSLPSNDRYSILEGACDSRGKLVDGNLFLQTTPQKKKFYLDLIRSLGIWCKYFEDRGIRIKANCKLTQIDGKLDKYNIPKVFPYRIITDIQFYKKRHCKCIYIESPCHQYITDNYIPTHNTTLGRIVANKVNDGKGEPIELDAASHNGVDAMRELVSQASMYPIGSKYKVFIIDECHAISNQGWQVLLKTLEESPAMSILIFCTTDPEKIPATILSRVQTFTLSKISLDGVFSRLKHVLDSEIAEGQKLTYDDEALRFIAKLANGGMRDALTLLDKSLAYTSELTSETVSQALNLPKYEDYFELLNGYAKKDNESIVKTVDRIYNSGVNYVKWFEGFHSFVINVVKYIFTQDIEYTVIPYQYRDKLSKYSTPHCVICLKLANLLVKLIHELKSTQYLQELTLTYMCSDPRKAK